MGTISSASYESVVSTSLWEKYLQKGCEWCDPRICVTGQSYSLWAGQHQRLRDALFRDPGQLVSKHHGLACCSAWRRSWQIQWQQETSRNFENGWITINWMDHPESVLTLRWILRFVCRCSGVGRWLPQIQLMMDSTEPSPLYVRKCNSISMHEDVPTFNITSQTKSSGNELLLFVHGKPANLIFWHLFSYPIFTKTQRWRAACRTPHHGLPVTNNLPVWPRSMLLHRDKEHLFPYKPLAASVPISGKLEIWHEFTSVFH